MIPKNDNDLPLNNYSFQKPGASVYKKVFINKHCSPHRLINQPITKIYQIYGHGNEMKQKPDTGLREYPSSAAGYKFTSSKVNKSQMPGAHFLKAKPNSK